MSRKAFDKIAGGLNEAIAVARGEEEPTRVHIPDEIDVRGIRKRTNLSQNDFASAFGFSSTQIKDWEQGRSRPVGGVRAYLLLIEASPESVRGLLASRHRPATAAIGRTHRR